MARPSIYSQQIADEICQRLVDGESLRKICRDDHMPAVSTIFNWLGDAEHKPFLDQYTLAREAQAETLFDEILDIADDGRNDSYEDEDGMQRVNYDVIARSKLRVDARKWMAGKMQPKKYGEKIVQEVTGKDGGAIETKSLSDIDVARRLAFLLTKGASAKS